MRDSIVSEKVIVWGPIFQRKGKSPKGKESQNFSLGRYRRCIVLSLFSGALSADKELFMPWIRACPWLFLIMHEAETTWSKKEREEKI